ncbi:predicted protein [Streptomyces sp. AA4]|nr:predicted protein [Streptomyces sp. AA4]
MRPHLVARRRLSPGIVFRRRHGGRWTWLPRFPAVSTDAPTWSPWLARPIVVPEPDSPADRGLPGPRATAAPPGVVRRKGGSVQFSRRAKRWEAIVTGCDHGGARTRVGYGK